MENRSPAATHCTYQDNVVDLHVAIWVILVHDVDAPLSSLLVIFGTSFDGSFSPDVEFHSFGIVLEPTGKLVLGCY